MANKKAWLLLLKFHGGEQFKVNRLKDILQKCNAIDPSKNRCLSSNLRSYRRGKIAKRGLWLWKPLFYYWNFTNIHELEKIAFK